MAPVNFTNVPHPSPSLLMEATHSYPMKVVSGHAWTLYGTTSLWSLGYPRLNMNTISTLRPNAMAIDWVFIITYLLSFIPFLFTFDAISGERERGTLRLCFANSISRSALLVLRHWLSDGYNLLSLMRASCVVNRQFTVVGC